MSTVCASDCCKCARNKECTYASTSSKNAVVVHSFCGQRSRPSARAWVGVPLPLARRDALDACADLKGEGASTQYHCCPTVSDNYRYECDRDWGQCDRKGSIIPAIIPATAGTVNMWAYIIPIIVVVLGIAICVVLFNRSRNAQMHQMAIMQSQGQYGNTMGNNPNNPVAIPLLKPSFALSPASPGTRSCPNLTSPSTINYQGAPYGQPYGQPPAYGQPYGQQYGQQQGGMGTGTALALGVGGGLLGGWALSSAMDGGGYGGGGGDGGDMAGDVGM